MYGCQMGWSPWGPCTLLASLPRSFPRKRCIQVDWTLPSHVIRSMSIHVEYPPWVATAVAMGPSQQEFIYSYRQLYKHLLRAVRYSKPARFIARNRLRVEFRYGDVSKYDQIRISRTLEFLDAASKSAGLEHRLVKNLMHVWWEQQAFQRKTMYGSILSYFILHKILISLSRLGRTKRWHWGRLRSRISVTRSGC